MLVLGKMKEELKVVSIILKVVSLIFLSSGGYTLKFSGGSGISIPLYRKERTENRNI